MLVNEWELVNTWDTGAAPVTTNHVVALDIVWTVDSAITYTTIPPVLSLPTATIIDSTTVLPSVTTDTAEGTLTVVIVPTLATAPTSTQVLAHTDGNDNPATAFADETVTASGVYDFATIGGLAESTAYDLYFAHEDVALNVSTPPVTVEFTTTAAGIGGYSAASRLMKLNII